MKASAGRVLMLVENCYPADTRVRNEAVTLTENDAADWSFGNGQAQLLQT